MQKFGKIINCLKKLKIILVLRIKNYMKFKHPSEKFL